MRTTKKFDIVLFITSHAAGLAAWLVGTVLYHALEEKMAQSLLIGLEFLLLFVIVSAAVIIVGAVKGTFEDFVLFLDEKWKIFLFLAAGGIAVFGLGVLFQFLYGLNSEKAPEGPSSYIFLIDDSGSMQESDPNMLRYEAIEQVLDGMPEDFPYMIYSFSNDVQKIRDMRPISDGVGEIPSESNGGTSIRGALNRVLDDYKDKIWQDDQRRTKVILLTDGYATDIGFFRPIGRTLKKFAKAHISVSTVGLGQVDTKLMEKIAETTDGVFLQAEDAALLKDAMTSAARQYSEVRNLLSVRAPQEKDWLYGMMRVLFLTLLGTGIGCMMIFASTKEEDAVLITVSSAAKSLAGALLMEILVQGAGVSANVMWLILWLLIAALISRVEETIGRYAGGSGRSSNISGYTSGSGRSSNISRY